MSQTNTEIVVELPIQKFKIKKNNKKNMVVEEPIVEEPPVVELNDFTEDTGEDEDEDETINQLQAQLKQLQKEKKEKELRKNIVALRTTAMEIAEAKRQVILTKIEALQQEQLAVGDIIVSINNGDMDEELITTELNKNEKIKKEKKETTYEVGLGKARLQQLKTLNEGKYANKLTYSKTSNGKVWNLLFEERKDGGLAVYKNVGNDEYFIPLFKDVAKLIGEDIKTRSDYLEWIKN
jgi:hypothetical protein